MGAIPNNPQEVWIGRKHEESNCNKNWVAFCIGLVYTADISPSMSFVGQPRLTEDPSGAGGTQRTFKNGSFPWAKPSLSKTMSTSTAVLLKLPTKLKP